MAMVPRARCCLCRLGKACHRRVRVFFCREKIEKHAKFLGLPFIPQNMCKGGKTNGPERARWQKHVGRALS
jgi:hypothetical protein